MKSLKRKKPSTALSTKTAQTKKGRQSTAIAPPKAAASTGTLTNALNAIDTLQHLIDRPYHEYDNNRDDIG
jgi:hypothetical protein